MLVRKTPFLRAKTEHDNQIASYNNLQANYYENDLPEFCRREFEVHQLLTESWKKNLVAFRIGSYLLFSFLEKKV
jgi:hypothetical protein